MNKKQTSTIHLMNKKQTICYRLTANKTTDTKKTSAVIQIKPMLAVFIKFENASGPFWDSVFITKARIKIANTRSIKFKKEPKEKIYCLKAKALDLDASKELAEELAFEIIGPCEFLHESTLDIFFSGLAFSAPIFAAFLPHTKDYSFYNHRPF